MCKISKPSIRLIKSALYRLSFSFPAMLLDLHLERDGTNYKGSGGKNEQAWRVAMKRRGQDRHVGSLYYRIIKMLLLESARLTIGSLTLTEDTAEVLHI